ncbi:DUF2834 domain-containing protein [Bowmanella denitrificans]|uniref:DUF2834 domain-containing protein n=1 Tax=Bowmanella denitrificans TaxID=366582 RepID=UPI001C0EE1E8|nr:DUF2834 domain-containing protein [Bowmanella denitrificans]
MLGTLLPLAAVWSWLSQQGLNLPMLVSEISASSLSLFAWLDVALSALVLSVFILVDGRKQKIASAWTAVVATFCVGVSQGLPLYLLLRDRYGLERRQSGAASSDKH